MTRDPHRKALVQRNWLIGQLRASDEPGAAALAVTLDGCTDRSPCRSPACPVCALAWQGAAVSVVNRLFDIPARAIRGRMHALTTVPASGCVGLHDLTAEECERVATEIKAAFATLGQPPSITGLEISFNEDTTGEVEPHWSIHGHSLGLGWLSAAQQNGLKAIFPSSHQVKRPICCEPLDQNDQGRRYPFKPERFRRVTRRNTESPNREPYRATKHRQLRPWQAARLAIVDDQLGFGGRLLIHGIDEDAVWRQLECLGWVRDGP